MINISTPGSKDFQIVPFNAPFSRNSNNSWYLHDYLTYIVSVSLNSQKNPKRYLYHYCPHFTDKEIKAQIIKVKELVSSRIGILLQYPGSEPLNHTVSQEGLSSGHPLGSSPNFQHWIPEYKYNEEYNRNWKDLKTIIDNGNSVYVHLKVSIIIWLGASWWSDNESLLYHEGNVGAHQIFMNIQEKAMENTQNANQKCYMKNPVSLGFPEYLYLEYSK